VTIITLPTLWLVSHGPAGTGVPAIDDFPDKETIYDRFRLKSSKKG
jgi:hypothetical protein